MESLKYKKQYKAINKVKDRPPWQRLLILVVLFALLIITALPNYLQNSWFWVNPLKAENLSQLKELHSGLTVPGWNITLQEKRDLGTNIWSQQVLKKGEQEITLFITPQTYYKNKPEVQWNDLKGFQRWQVDNKQKLNFTIFNNNHPITVESNFMRAWNRKQTYAVVQWFAWRRGGDYANEKWFVADQKAQLKGEREPWIAICFTIPIEPLGDIQKVRPTAQSIAEEIQKAITQKYFSS